MPTTQPENVAGAPPIVQYWHSSEVPRDVAALAATFRDRNPDLRHLLLHREAAEELIAERFTDREVVAFRACAVPAMQADYLRYCAVLALGGVYADVGFACVRPLRPLLEDVEGGLLLRLPTGVIVNGFFAFPAPGHPLLRLSLDVATANIEGRVTNAVNRVTGPWIFTGLFNLWRSGSLDASCEPLARSDALLRAFREAIGDYARLDAAFRGTQIAPLLANEWIAKPAEPLAYKSSDLDWLNWCRQGKSIFR